MSAVHTVVVGETRPGRYPAGRDANGRTIWREVADRTETDVRCIECDQVVGKITDALDGQRLHAYWQPAPYQLIPLGIGTYIVRDDDRDDRAEEQQHLAAVVRDCHQVQMDALHTPMPQKRSRVQAGAGR